ncbi:hypothetical protein CK203_113060 [Vitis vinifera]|uniref:Uncharacterized protein n=1 Tax=Vitis vinifera TaxID=29760 RepID=A0A438FG76_VITVI|nr:hypothetical protein CK203_113060 [Vitis vinifera]
MRLEKEREKTREIEKEREKTRQAVERATREAHERAASEFCLKAQRAAVEKANAEAREHVERVQILCLKLTLRTGLGLKEQGGHLLILILHEEASSTTNVVDALQFLKVVYYEFQEVEDDSEERIRARLEGPQRAQKRAAKALAEKNQWDFQTLREQAERHGSWLALILDIEAPPLPLMKWSGFQVGLQHNSS